MPAATAAFLDDAAVDVGAWIADEVNAAFAEQETAAFVNGNGTNKPKGFLAETQVAEGSWAWDSIGFLATGVSGGWPAEDVGDVLIDLVYTLKAGYRQNASWVMNRRDARGGAQAQGRRGQLSVVAGGDGGGEGDAAGVRAGGGRGHAQYRRPARRRLRSAISAAAIWWWTAPG